MVPGLYELSFNAQMQQTGFISYMGISIRGSGFLVLHEGKIVGIMREGDKDLPVKGYYAETHRLINSKSGCIEIKLQGEGRSHNSNFIFEFDVDARTNPKVCEARLPEHIEFLHLTFELLQAWPE